MNTKLSFLNKNLSKASFKEPRLIFQQATPGENADSAERIHLMEYNEFCRDLPTIVEMVDNGLALYTNLGKLSVVKKEGSTTLRLGEKHDRLGGHFVGKPPEPDFPPTITLHANGLLTMEDNGIHCEYNPLPRFSENAKLLFDKVGFFLARLGDTLVYYRIKRDFEKSKDAANKDTSKQLGKLMDDVENGGSGVP